MNDKVQIQCKICGKYIEESIDYAVNVLLTGISKGRDGHGGWYCSTQCRDVCRLNPLAYESKPIMSKDLIIQLLMTKYGLLCETTQF